MPFIKIWVHLVWATKKEYPVNKRYAAAGV